MIYIFRISISFEVLPESVTKGRNDNDNYNNFKLTAHRESVLHFTESSKILTIR